MNILIATELTEIIFEPRMLEVAKVKHPERKFFRGRDCWGYTYRDSSEYESIEDMVKTYLAECILNHEAQEREEKKWNDFCKNS